MSMSISELDELKQKIRAGVKRYYETEAGKRHRRKLSEAMKQKWRELKKGGGVNEV